MSIPKDPIKNKLWRKRQSKAHKGQKPWCSGKHLSKAHKDKLMAYLSDTIGAVWGFRVNKVVWNNYPQKSIKLTGNNRIKQCIQKKNNKSI